MKSKALIFLLFALITTTVFAEMELQLVASNLTDPVAITHANDGSGRLFITQQDGKILIFDGNQILSTPFLDISDLVSCCGEQGLLSVAFHPDYTNNGYFFVNYTNANGNTVVRRYTVSADANVADPLTAKTILTIGQPYSNHNGGQLQFGPDGFLYIGMGDGGSGGDPQNRAQNPQSLLGKMLRIDIDNGDPYSIPASNPFASSDTTLHEIWAMGLRNPWRFSFDRSTGDLIIGDVGQDNWEEFDFQLASSTGGENYGWRRMEGRHCYNPSSGCNNGQLTFPAYEYRHSSGRCSITGGYRYRGTQIAQLGGLYVFGDYCTGEIWGSGQNSQDIWQAVLLFDTDFLISTFGEDEDGELYVANHPGGSGGAIYKLVDTGGPQLFADDFEDGIATDWSIASGKWKVVNGEYQGKSSTKAKSLAPFQGCTLCTIETDVKVATAGARASLFGWYQNSSNYVEVRLSEAGDELLFMQKSGGQVVAKQSIPQTVDLGVSYHITITYNGFSFQISVFGTPVLSVDAGASASGNVGFRVVNGTGLFGQVTVY